MQWGFGNRNAWEFASECVSRGLEAFMYVGLVWAKYLLDEMSQMSEYRSENLD